MDPEEWPTLCSFAAGLELCRAPAASAEQAATGRPYTNATGTGSSSSSSASSLNATAAETIVSDSTIHSEQAAVLSFALIFGFALLVFICCATKGECWAAVCWLRRDITGPAASNAPPRHTKGAAAESLELSDVPRQSEEVLSAAEP